MTDDLALFDFEFLSFFFDCLSKLKSSSSELGGHFLRLALMRLDRPRWAVRI